jgi:hypothetical protein
MNGEITLKFADEAVHKGYRSTPAKAQNQSHLHILYTPVFLAITWGICFWINAKREL